MLKSSSSKKLFILLMRSSNKNELKVPPGLGRGKITASQSLLAKSCYSHGINRPSYVNDQRTFGKIQIWDMNESKWKLVLTGTIPRDQLPALFGGRRLSQLDELLGLDELDSDEDDDADSEGQARGRSCVTVAAGGT